MLPVDMSTPQNTVHVPRLVHSFTLLVLVTDSSSQQRAWLYKPLHP